jgi:hypothetical protein
MSQRLRQTVRKPLSDDNLLALLHTLTTTFPFVRIFLIVGLPEETEADQDAMTTLLSQLLQHRSNCWKGNPAHIRISSTPFQAMPHTPLERSPAPTNRLVTAWRQRLAQMNRRYEFFAHTTVKVPLTADVAFAMHRLGPEIAPILADLGSVYDGSTWGTWKTGKFDKLATQAGIHWRDHLQNLDGPLPWSPYVTLHDKD